MTLVRRGWTSLEQAEPLLLIARCSLLVLLINTNDDPAAFILVAVTCLLVLPRPSVLLNPWFWGAAFVAMGIRHLANWHTLDDHIILSVYWCGALALALGARSPHLTLGASARWLIGSLFAFAAAWKLGSGEFIDGRFFRYSLLFDDRFRAVADWIGGTSDALDASNRVGLQAVVDADDGAMSIALAEGPQNRAVAWALTGWGAAVELAVAVTFLVPLRQAWGWLRHAALIAFATTTYVVVPIGGFGAVLLVLASSMVTTGHARAAYVTGGLVLLIWAGVWPALFL